jgi:hypothetical protein
MSRSIPFRRGLALDGSPRFNVFVLLAVFVALPFLFTPAAIVLGQAIDAPPGPQGPQAFPWEAMAVNWINGLQVVLIPALAAGVKKWLKAIEVKVPRFVILAGVVMLGVTAETLNAWVGAGGFSLFRGALMGFVAVAVREVWDTIREHGLTGK